MYTLYESSQIEESKLKKATPTSYKKELLQILKDHPQGIHIDKIIELMKTDYQLLVKRRSLTTTLTKLKARIAKGIYKLPLDK